MSKKHRNTKTYNPPPKPHVPSQQIPKKFSSYILLNPAYPVELVYQILTNTGKNKEPMMMIKGKPEDFAATPNVMFRKVNQEVNLQQNDSENTMKPQ